MCVRTPWEGGEPPAWWFQEAGREGLCTRAPRRLTGVDLASLMPRGNLPSEWVDEASGAKNTGTQVWSPGRPERRGEAG